VPYHPLNNYLRSARRRSGFSQDEIAVLLGGNSGTKISRYEKFVRMPSVATVFAYEVIFRAAARELFAGAYEEVHRVVVGRAKLLMETLDQANRDRESLRKMKFLRAIVEGDSKQTNQ
jgi:transcriptional regulator with XRE-family HTH domain